MYLFTEGDKKIINNSLKIKDFIIIEEENFHEKINVLEKYIFKNRRNI